ncbi:MAG: hypothetical protein WBV62_09380, partial [Roseobacter sp.]
IYRKTGNLRAVQLLPGHAKVDSKVRYSASSWRTRSASPTFGVGSYTSQWWVFQNDHGAIAACCVYGQPN